MAESSSEPSNTLGIDIGMATVKLVLSASQGQEAGEKIYRFHYGNPLQVIKEEAERLKLNGIGQVLVTGTNVDLFVKQAQVPVVDFVKAEIAAVKPLFPKVRNIIDIGSSSVSLIRLNEEAEFHSYSTNSLCAAGTGSFLDEQAGRLGISYGDLDSLTFNGDPPSIATRCAVFAKSDITHRQQEGYSKPAMWSGLCRGMTETLLQTLLKGKPLQGLTVITGGVALNSQVIYWLKARYGDLVQTYPEAHLAGAMGAALLAGRAPASQGTKLFLSQGGWNSLTDKEEGAAREEQQKPLVLIKSRYPDFRVQEEYLDCMGNEVRVTRWPQTARECQVFLGIDIGSTSTKMVVMNDQEGILIDLYRKTAGDPIGATKQLFGALSELCAARATALKIMGCGATGSGRKLVGKVVGADAIMNEISAHVTGALKQGDTVDTIFEIGGQDSKYMRTRGGHIYDSNMNYACAAGTGSFVEEQAKKLGFALTEVGQVVLGIAPPLTSDRCTVFMEQDVHKLVRKGYTREECMAAVMYSVVQNYLNKVVGKRYVSKEKIVFQGATARNVGLVAAFENLLGVEVVVSPYCHVMGAYGVAILTRKILKKGSKATAFKGLSLAERKIEIRYQTCDFCRDHCQLSYATIEGEKEEPSWGYMCGREPEAGGKKANDNFSTFLLREKLFYSAGKDSSLQAKEKVKVVAIPRALTTYTFYPLWRRFFNQLGFKMVLSPPSSKKIIQEGVKLAATDFCFPIKLSLGHLRALLSKEGIDYIFLPFMISSEKNPKTSNSYFCPYVQGFSGVAKTALVMNDIDSGRVLAPVVDFRWPEEKMVRELAHCLGKRLKKSSRQIAEAWRRAWQWQKTFVGRCEEEGRKALAEIEKTGQVGIVCIGRPYNTLDLGANLALPRKIAELGYRVIPIDFIPDDNQDIEPYANMFWYQGQKILNAIRLVKGNPNLFAVYFTNFNCGPDSFILNFAEHEMGDKPFLILEVDEHGADAGYITRIEAFLDVVKAWQPKEERPVLYRPREEPEEFKRRKVWIPPMHPVASRLFAAAFRGYGYQCEALADETNEALALGKALARGSECLPMAATIGSFVSKLKEIGADPGEHAFFMPTADGPCRFGQYALLQRMILNRIGYQDVLILSPSSMNTYQGLPEELRRHLFKSLVVSDSLTKCACKVRPYELHKGKTNQVLEKNLKKMELAFEEQADLEATLTQAADEFAAIPRAEGVKPLVGIVGEIYVRCSRFCNEDLIGAIEDYGGEAWLTPMTEWILYTSAMEKWESGQRGDGLWDRTKSVLKNYLMIRAEHGLARPAHRLLYDRGEPPISQVIKEGARYVPVNFGGEAIITIGRAVLFARQGAKLVVNCAPFGCMPGSISTAILQGVEQALSIPIVSVFYDGQGGLNYPLKFFLQDGQL